LPQLSRKLRRGAFSNPAPGVASHSKVELRPEEGSRGQHDGTCGNDLTIRKLDSGHANTVQLQTDGFSFNNRESWLGVQHLLNCAFEPAAVGLHARSPHGSALAGVQHPVVDCGVIGGVRDQSVKCIYFTNKVSLSKSPYSWVTGHRSNRVAGEA
jgi:hypothetical protein